MSYMKNFLLNALKRKYFFVTIKKFLRKFEKNTFVEAKKWAKLNTEYDTEKLCRSIDTLLFDEILLNIMSLEIALNALTVASPSPISPSLYKLSPVAN